MSRTVLGFAFTLVAAAAALVGLVAGGGGTVRLGGAAGAVSAPVGSFADIVEKVNPAVVHVTVVEKASAAAAEEDEQGEDGGDEGGAPPDTGPRRGEGSGFVVDPAGYILTNHHLVSSPARIRVRLADKREFPARLVGSDPSTDLALIKVNATGLPAVPLGDSDRLRVGDWVCAIGNPYSFDHSVTVGVVSSKGRKIWDASFDSYIQTDAAINPGNSGGPLLDAAGEAVGINAAVSTEGQGIGFAIPVNVAKEIMGQLRSRGHVTRGYLGVQLQELDPDLEKLVGLKEAKGALVVDVVKGSAGEAAGLKRWDVITAVSGQPVEDGDHLVRAISAKAPGTPVALGVVRDGRELSLEARLTERAPDAEQADAQPAADDASRRGDALGLVVGELGRRARTELKVPADRRGVVIKDVLGLSPGIDPLANGDIVFEVNRRPTPDLPSYKRVLASLKPGEMAWLVVFRPRPASTFLAKVEVEGR